MANLLKLRRGTTAQHSTFTGASGEITVDTSKNTVVVHDNAVAGGYPLSLDTLVAHLAGTETITGIKTFSAAPVMSAGAKLSASGWSITETAGVLYIAYGGVNKAKLDSSGNLTVAGNVTAYGTV